MYQSQNQTRVHKEESTISRAPQPITDQRGGPNLHRVVPIKEPRYYSRPNQNPPPLPDHAPLEPVATPIIDLLPMQTVRPVIASRSVIINRTVADPFNRGSRAYQSERSVRTAGGVLPVVPGTFSNVASSGVEAVVESRGKEKKDMQDLNERLANYLEKVRFLEAQNRNLANELERLKEKWGKETSQVKAMYQLEVDEARKVLDEAVQDKGKLEIKVASLEDIIEELKDKLDEARAAAESWKEKWQAGIQRVSDAEAETMASKRLMEGLSGERERERKSMAKLQALLSNTRMDLDHETYRHLEAASKLQTLEEELDFLKSVHQQEMEEMSTLVNKDTTVDNRNFWMNKMGSALKEIQELYDSKLEEVRAQCETSYATKMQEFKSGVSRSSMEVGQSREENKKLKATLIDIRNRMSQLEGQNLNLKREAEGARRDGESRERELEAEKVALRGDIVKMRSEMDAIMAELQQLMNSKMGLELEISAYRKLLEGEEDRVENLEAHLKRARTGVRDTQETQERNEDRHQNQYNSFRNQTSGGGASVQRSARGPCVVAEASDDGRRVVVENTGRKEEKLDRWVLRRYVAGKESASFIFPGAFTLKPNAQVKVWARGYKSRSSPDDLEATFSSWGRGQDTTVKLFNAHGEEKASLYQAN